MAVSRSFSLLFSPSLSLSLYLFPFVIWVSRWIHPFSTEYRHRHKWRFVYYNLKKFLFNLCRILFKRCVLRKRHSHTTATHQTKKTGRIIAFSFRAIAWSCWEGRIGKEGQPCGAASLPRSGPTRDYITYNVNPPSDILILCCLRLKIMFHAGPGFWSCDTITAEARFFFFVFFFVFFFWVVSQVNT